MKKVAIFDLDGTLLNTLESIAFCGNTALKKFGFPTVDVSVYSQFIGKGAPVLIDRLYRYVGGDPAGFDEFFSFTMGVYAEYGDKNITAYDGIDEMLERLRVKGVKCAVLTNKPHDIAVNVCNEFFAEKFDCVYGHRDGVAKKPDPTMIYGILNELGFDKAECVYCGDSDVDVLTAKNAGVTMLGAAWGFYGDAPFADADAVLPHPTELLNHV